MHDAEWQSMRDYIDQDGTMKEQFLNQMKGNYISHPHYANND